METIVFISGLVFLSFIGIIILIIFHKVLSGTIIYRWFTGSLTYRYHIYIVKKMVKKMRGTDKVVLSEQIENVKKWRRDFWFGKRLKKLLVSELEKLLKE